MELKFEYSGVVLTPENLRYNPRNDLIFPSVIPTENMAGTALGRFYLYYAPHDAPGGICLAYSNSLEGPWTEYEANPIITREWPPHYSVSHISSPHMLWMEAESKFFLYFHGENDTTRIASTRDGIHFGYESVAISTAMYDGISEASYARVFPCDQGPEETRFVLLFMGNNGGTRRIYAAWSVDGRSFTAQRTPLINPPPGTGVTQVGAPWYLPWDGRNLVLFHGDISEDIMRELTTSIYVADVGPSFTSENHLGTVLEQDDVSADNQRVSDPCIVQADGQFWLFMAVGARLHQTIGLARQSA